jgi:hypothetical protein
MRKAIDRNSMFPCVISDQSQAKQIDLNEESWEKISMQNYSDPDESARYHRSRKDAIEGNSPLVLKAWTFEETGWAYRAQDGSLIADPNFRHFASKDGDILFGKSGNVFVDIYQQK